MFLFSGDTPGLPRGLLLAVAGPLVKFRRVVGIQKPVQVNDHILDVGLVDVSMAGAAPGLERRFVIGVDAENVELVRVDEIGSLRVFDLAAENHV